MVIENRSKDESEILTGIFYDSPVQGLEYETQTISGITNEKGEFQYRLGETATFSISGLVLGSALGRGMVTPADMAVDVCGDVKRIKNYKVTSIARFLQSLDRGGDIENRIVITDEVREVLKHYIYKIDFEQSEEAFSADENVQAIFAELKAPLRTAAQARNHLRRTLYGIRKKTDVKIPTRDGSFLYADVYRPVVEGKYPALLCLGILGKAFGDMLVCNEKDRLANEDVEDKWFSGNGPEAPWGGGPMIWEKGEAANTVDWVPHGYVIIRIDPRGYGKTPGMAEMLSYQEAKDFYDAIEWSAKQPWCNGNIGLWGTGYHAMNSYNVAQLQPPSLKAMIPVCGDVDSFRDHTFIGGLFNTFDGVQKKCCGEWKGVEWVDIAKENPFCDPEIYGPTGIICISPDLNKINIPFWASLGLTGTLHTRGSSEAFIHAKSEHKKLTIVSEPQVHYWAFGKEFLDGDKAFFDYWLKGIRSDIMERPPVRMMIRTGRRGYYWQYEDEWPIARTQYTKYYLDATPSSYNGDGKKTAFMKLNKTSPHKESSSSYEGGVEWKNGENWRHGVSFITGPLSEDIVIAGYLKLVIWVSSTTRDMELHASVRVMDGENEVPYPLEGSEASSSDMFPIGFGALKVSHRKLDSEKSTIYRPYHTHKKEDYQPMVPGEPVEAEVELWPTTARIKKGWRVRLDVQPLSGDHIPMRIFDIIDQTYQKGAMNTVYTGPKHRSYLQLPLIPEK